MHRTPIATYCICLSKLITCLPACLYLLSWLGAYFENHQYLMHAHWAPALLMQWPSIDSSHQLAPAPPIHILAASSYSNLTLASAVHASP